MFSFVLMLLESNSVGDVPFYLYFYEWLKYIQLQIQDCAVLDLHADGSLDLGIAWRLGRWHVRWLSLWWTGWNPTFDPNHHRDFNVDHHNSLLQLLFDQHIQLLSSFFWPSQYIQISLNPAIFCRPSSPWSSCSSSTLSPPSPSSWTRPVRCSKGSWTYHWVRK